MEPKENLWIRLSKLDPAVYKGVVVGVVALLASVGVFVSPDIPDSIVALIVAIASFIQAVWVRGSVTPNAKVVIVMPDPEKPRVIQAGEAATTASDNIILSAAKMAGSNDGTD